MNSFLEKSSKIQNYFTEWKNIYAKPYNKNEVDFISKNNKDYRFETKENPILALRDRKSDNTSIGRTSLS